MGKYLLTRKAVQDLSEIWHYTLHTWSEAQADKYYYLLLDTCQALADEKIFGRSYQTVKNGLWGVRAGEHVIFYIKLEGNKIEVVRILHSRMDLRTRILE
jgi:toxin ParE1/3/4